MQHKHKVTYSVLSIFGVEAEWIGRIPLCCIYLQSVISAISVSNILCVPNVSFLPISFHATKSRALICEGYIAHFVQLCYPYGLCTIKTVTHKSTNKNIKGKIGINRHMLYWAFLVWRKHMKDSYVDTLPVLFIVNQLVHTYSALLYLDVWMGRGRGGEGTGRAVHLPWP